jgi:Uma2 family endonuclease
VIPFDDVGRITTEESARGTGPMSIADWVAMPEDEPGELVDGFLVEEEMPDLVHETVVVWLISVLRSWIIARGGFVFGSEAKFAVGPRRGRKPDVTMYLPGCKALPRRGAVRIPPDVAVEIISPTARDARRDRIEKAQDYAAFGVRYYWLFDPTQRTLEILELGEDGRYGRALSATAGRLDRIPGCEGLILDLDNLWAEVDRLGPEEPDDTTA